MMASQHHSIDSASVMEVDFGSRHAPPPDDRVPEVGANAAEEVQSAASGASIYPPEIPPEPPRRKRWVGLLLGLLALCAFVAVVWFAYDRGLSGAYRDEVPTIQAESGPVKVKPENPGGLQVPNQDKLVLNGPEGEGEEPVERLLSGPETPEPPTPLVAPEPSGPLVTLPADEPLPSGEAGETTGAEPARQSAEAVLEPEAAAPEAAAPDSGTVESDPAADTVARTLAALAQRARQEEEIEAARQREAQAAAEKQAAAAGAAGVSGGAATGDSGAAGGSAGGSAGGTGAASSPTATQVVAIEKGDYVIQLASVTSAEAAKGEWGRIRAAHPDLLGDMTLSVQQATVNGTLYHRVQTGPFPSRATAQDLCAQLQSKKQPCIVQRR